MRAVDTITGENEKMGTEYVWNSEQEKKQKEDRDLQDAINYAEAELVYLADDEARIAREEASFENWLDEQEQEDEAE